MEYIPGPHSLGKWAVLHDCQPRLYPTFNGWFGRFEVTILDGTTPALAQLAPGGRLAECLPPEFNVRTRVHEYGGGAFAVFDGVIYFANFKDQHLHREFPRCHAPGCLQVHPIAVPHAPSGGGQELVVLLAGEGFGRWAWFDDKTKIIFLPPIGGR